MDFRAFLNKNNNRYRNALANRNFVSLLQKHPFDIPQAHDLALDKTENSRMLGEYCNKLFPQNFGGKKILFFFCLAFSEFWSGV